MDVKIDSYGVTDIGERSANEDQFLIADLRRAMVVEQTSLVQNDGSFFWGTGLRYLYLVADGVGGAGQGEEASRAATAAIERHLLHTMPWLLSLRQDSEDDLVNELKRIMQSSGDAAGEVVKSDLSPHKPATTLTMAYVIWPRMYVVHAGDCRCYVYRSGEIRQITTDHTVAQQLADRGILDQDKADDSRWSNVLWNSLGGDKPGVVAVVHKATLWPGDTILLCTDGITHSLDDDRIASIIGEASSAEKASTALIAAARDNGAQGNATAVVARFGPV